MKMSNPKKIQDDKKLNCPAGRRSLGVVLDNSGFAEPEASPNLRGREKDKDRPTHQA